MAMVPVASRSGVRSSRTRTSSCAILVPVFFPWPTLAKTPTVPRYVLLLLIPLYPMCDELFLNDFYSSSFSSPLSRLPGWMVATLFSALCSRAWTLSSRSRTPPLALAMHQLTPSPSPPLARSPSKTPRSFTPSFEINYFLALWLCLGCATKKKRVLSLLSSLLPQASQISTMDVHGSLDAIITAVPNHRQYHPGLVNELVTALATRPEHHHNPSLVAQHGKQVKRLVNQSLSTLTLWSKALHSPEQSDVIARGVTYTTVSTSNYATATTEPFATGTTKTTTAETTSGKNDRQSAATATTRGARLSTRETRPTLGTPNEINLPSRHPRAVSIANSKSNHSSSMTSKASGSTTITGLTVTELSAGGRQNLPLGNNSGIASTNSLYCTDRPTYAHIAMLVDISFLGIESLENMSQDISAGIFEIEKARSNLASKIIELGMVRSIRNATRLTSLHA